jgi:SPP1 family predicted phage head-tail adaptor
MTSKIRSSVGPLRHRVAIQARTVTQDGYGATVATWATAATVWASVEPLSGREAWQAQSVRPDVTHTVTIRAYDGLTPKHRLLFDGRTLEIESVVNLEERNRYMVLQCKEAV